MNTQQSGGVASWVVGHRTGKRLGGSHRGPMFWTRPALAAPDRAAGLPGHRAHGQRRGDHQLADDGDRPGPVRRLGQPVPERPADRRRHAQDAAADRRVPVPPGPEGAARAGDSARFQHATAAHRQGSRVRRAHDRALHHRRCRGPPVPHRPLRGHAQQLGRCRPVRVGKTRRGRCSSCWALPGSTGGRMNVRTARQSTTATGYPPGG
jgi:hypothetical protein